MDIMEIVESIEAKVCTAEEAADLKSADLIVRLLALATDIATIRAVIAREEDEDLKEWEKEEPEEAKRFVAALNRGVASYNYMAMELNRRIPGGKDGR